MLTLVIVSNKISEMLVSTIMSVAPLSPQVLISISSGTTKPLGLRKNNLINQAAYDWVLVLDTDELISKEAVVEIKKIMGKPVVGIHAYEIPYRNYAFGKHIKFGGENYAKARLFKKQFSQVVLAPVHEEITTLGKIGRLKGVIYHNSYRSFFQVIQKFTKYAWQMAEEKRKSGERVTLKKLFMYGPHMVWARVIKDHGWRDGWQGIVLALCFGYMESLMYWILLYKNLFSR